ncbi:MAG TPA: crossover junction endodeoxyribonuclease RuvC [Rhodothermales bacterium]
MSSGTLDGTDPRIYYHGTTVVLGVDPSMTATGYGVLRGDRLLGAGRISTPSKMPEPERLWIILSEVLALIQEFGAQHVAVESFTQFYTSGRNAPPDPTTAFIAALAGNACVARRGRHDRDRVDPRAMFLMKSAQTAVQIAALAAGVPLFLYKVSEWKGGQRVSKERARQQARLIYGVNARDDNICDGIMIAHHHAHTGRLRPERGVYVPAQERALALEALEIPDGAALPVRMPRGGRRSASGARSE